MITGVPDSEDDVTAWLLTTGERDNPATAIPAWTAGNLAEPLVHGAAYFDRLVDAVENAALHGDPDQCGHHGLRRRLYVDRPVERRTVVEYTRRQRVSVAKDKERTKSRERGCPDLHVAHQRGIEPFRARPRNRVRGS